MTSFYRQLKHPTVPVEIYSTQAGAAQGQYIIAMLSFHLSGQVATAVMHVNDVFNQMFH